ncbi:MAG: hypothetical protein NTV71_02910 [Candidatus Omnitrophica bacterium]|nr:hypothetical protein [Candidatus Omnitrophota bacterium]
MSNIFKIILVFLIIVSVVSIIMAVIGFVDKGREYAKRLVVEDKFAIALKEKKNIEKELETVRSAKELIEVEIAKREKLVEELSSQLEEAKQKSESVSAKLDASKIELAKIKIDLDNEKKEKLAMSKKFDSLKSDYDNIKKEASRLTKEKMDLEKRITESQEKQSVSLDTIVINPNDSNKMASQVVQPVMKGQILVVNKEYGFIVTDIGKDKNIQQGIKFDVMDGSKLLGQAQIDKIYDTMSSAVILPGGKIDDMKKGNVIVEIR